MGNPVSILIVENEYLAAHSEKLELENMGYKVYLAFSGEKAIEMITSNMEIRLILMDIELGKGIDGIQAADIISSKYDLPVIFLSNHIDYFIPQPEDSMWNESFCRKNSQPELIKRKISNVLENCDLYLHM